MIGRQIDRKLDVDGDATERERESQAYWDRYTRAKTAGRGFTWLWGARTTFSEFRYHGDFD